MIGNFKIYHKTGAEKWMFSLGLVPDSTPKTQKSIRKIGLDETAELFGSFMNSD